MSRSPHPMPTLPDGAVVYKRTPEFDQDTVPRGLLGEHRTRAGVYGRIVVLEGQLRYTVTEPARDSWMLRPGVDGIIAPEAAHFVQPQGNVRFVVEFLRGE